MKTLIVAPFSPYPLIFGGAIRLYHLIKMFASLSDVTLICYGTAPDTAASTRHLETICKRVIQVGNHPVESGNKGRLQMRATLGRRTFQYYSHYSRHFQEALDVLCRNERFDIVVVEQSQMGYFSLRQPGALRILDLQNIEYELLARRAAVEASLPKKIAMALEARKFKCDELAICRQFDMVFTPSQRERDVLRERLTAISVECVPNSIDAEYFALRQHTPTANEIAFIGATHVDANRDAVCFFVEEILPLIERRVPDIHLSIVGGNPPAKIHAYGARRNIEVTGLVPDVRPYMARAKTLVVPLRSGGGTRLKILEGLSFGVPTVSTSIGAEGIAVVHGEHLLLADKSQEFAQQVIRTLEDASLSQRLRGAGRQLVEENYSWQAVGQYLQSYLEAALNRRLVLATSQLTFTER